MKIINFAFMKITLVCIGKTRDSNIAQSIAGYSSRLTHYINFEFIALPDLKSTSKLTEQQQKEKEGAMILSSIQPSDRVILLDERGRMLTSREFAVALDRQMGSGLKRLVFVIGGPYGFSQAVYDRADSKLSLSKMTFSHEMVRLFFVEQVYRAMTILRGEPYHHD